jgi:hypothetical protein
MESQYSLAVKNDTLILLSRGIEIEVHSPTEYVNTTLANKGYKLKELNNLRAMATMYVQDFSAEELVKRKSIKLSEPLALLVFSQYKEIEAFVNSLIKQK